METTEKKGEAKGREESRAEGIYAVAKNMNDLGLLMSTITQTMGLSAEEIEKL